MKKFLISASFSFLFTVEAQAIKLENDYPDDVKFAIQTPNSFSPFATIQKIEELHGPGSKSVSIFDILQKARDTARGYPGQDTYLKFMVALGKKSSYQEVQIPTPGESNIRWFSLGKKTDTELWELDEKYILKVSRDGSIKFEKK